MVNPKSLRKNVQERFWIKRGIAVLIAGGVLLLIGVAVVIPSLSSLVSVADSLPPISAKDLIRSSVGNFVKGNQTAMKDTLKSIGYDIALSSFGILVSIILVINSIIAFVGGFIIVIYDRRSKNKILTK